MRGNLERWCVSGRALSSKSRVTSGDQRAHLLAFLGRGINELHVTPNSFERQAREDKTLE